MPEAIRLLRQEHANIAKLLNVLEHQLALFDEAEQPDYDILQGIADYFLTYPDRCHHPKEDIIFRKLKERDTAGAGEVGDLEAEHREGSRLAHQLAEAVKNVLEDVEVPRDAFHRVAWHFIDHERRHMKMEDDVFFPAALKALTPDDWAEIDARISDETDPLFGHEIEEQFKNLWEHIVNWEQEDSTTGEAFPRGEKRLQ
jgi:hemerythrin-like domain-containing protein